MEWTDDKYEEVKRFAQKGEYPTHITDRLKYRYRDRMAPFSVGDIDMVVDVVVDEQGRMLDYAIVAGASVLADSQMRKRLENALVFSNFTPAGAMPIPFKPNCTTNGLDTLAPSFGLMM